MEEMIAAWWLCSGEAGGECGPLPRPPPPWARIDLSLLGNWPPLDPVRRRGQGENTAELSEFLKVTFTTLRSAQPPGFTLQIQPYLPSLS